MTDEVLDACARAMFRRHNDGCLTRLEWDDLPPAARRGYIEDARTCLRVAAQETQRLYQ